MEMLHISNYSSDGKYENESSKYLPTQAHSHINNHRLIKKKKKRLAREMAQR